MEFRDVVMKRRAVRRFEEGGVDPAVIEGIARLAQRTPSAGFSQGQRLVVVTDPQARRRVARTCGEEEYADLGMGPWISECAAQFIPCVSAEIYHRRYQEPDKVDEEGREIEWPVPYWFVDIGATMMVIMLAAVDAGLASGFAGAFDPGGPPGGARHPRRVRADRGDAGGSAAPRRAVAIPEAGLGALRGVRPLRALGVAAGAAAALREAIPATGGPSARGPRPLDRR